MTQIPSCEDGDRVRVEYEGSYRGRDQTITGEVVTDPFTHRSTPEDALDLRVRGENGTYVARVTEDGVVYGLDHATRRHDNRKGGEASVTVQSEEEA